MIKIKNVVKKYGEKKVVDNVSAEIKSGKITSLIGPNGAGKSTLLSMISRINSRNAGEIYVDGRSIDDYESNTFAKILSILKQSNQIKLRLSVRDLVAFGRFPYSGGKLLAEDEEKIEQALDYMKLKDIENRFLNQLSGGQRQRAFIAMVIAQDTKYILLDEPLNNLDVKHSVDIMKRLKNLVQDLNKTVVLVLHDINFASCYSDNIIALNRGRVVKKGDTKDIINKKVLEGIYETKLDVEDFDERRICLYF